MASQIGSGLTGVLYVLDEPSIGLHQRDNKKLITALKKLRDLGNTVIVVEHDIETMESSDHIIDIGPEAGLNGGQIVAEGEVKQIIKMKIVLLEIIYLEKNLFQFQKREELQKMEDLLKLMEQVEII